MNYLRNLNALYEHIHEDVLVHGHFCEDCPHRHTYQELYPIGETNITETYHECTLVTVKDCPGVINILAAAQPHKSVA